ncbi:flagellar hook-length control protein FliK [Roseovarius pelagicus]|uniref:Flagellar hook-length control protein FliK n=1 Tax=Roseovarius pelagicus TaxID=2980108 RepID=A0ABY6D842_9RHOB|nr:flagellar hook-length control protein FliK [Roseovarius pelagicus]UXX82297.1 flagellar hook-length control protein FliK [Roseovarius pelagicus]
MTTSAAGDGEGVAEDTENSLITGRTPRLFNRIEIASEGDAYMRRDPALSRSSGGAVVPDPKPGIAMPTVSGSIRSVAGGTHADGISSVVIPFESPPLGIRGASVVSGAGPREAGHAPQVQVDELQAAMIERAAEGGLDKPRQETLLPRATIHDGAAFLDRRAVETAQPRSVPQVADTMVPQVTDTISRSSAFDVDVKAAVDKSATTGVDLAAPVEVRGLRDSSIELRAVLPPAQHRPETARQVAVQIADAAHRSGERVIDLSLNPAELGRVRLSLSTMDGALAVQVVAERQDTLDLMRRHIDLLAEEFRAIGYNGAAFDFAGQPGTHGRPDTADVHTDDTVSQDGGTRSEPKVAQGALTVATDRLDIRL